MNVDEEYQEAIVDTTTILNEQSIIAALDQTGFLLEQRVAQLLMANGQFTDVALNSPFQDPDSGKSREIDVTANMLKAAGDGSMGAAYLEAKLVVECRTFVTR